MGNRWDMGKDTLSQLAKKTTSGNQDLGGLVKQLVAAAQPLEGKMNGPAKAMFDNFKANVDGIAADLNAGLGRINAGQQQLDQAVKGADQQMSDAAKKAQSAANFDGAKFGKR